MKFFGKIVDVCESVLFVDIKYNHMTLEEATGAYSYIGKRYVDYDAYGNLVNANVDTNDHAYGEVQSTDVFTVRVWDRNREAANEERMLCFA